MKSWFNENLPDGFRQPDNDQLTAIGGSSGNLIVVAPAVSGKTITLVYRAFYLIVGQGIYPSEILLLAFNRKAAEKIQGRLTTSIHGKKDAPEVQPGVKITP